MHGGQFTLYTVRLQPHKIHLPPPKRDSKLLSCQYMYYDTFMAIHQMLVCRLMEEKEY